LSSSSFGLQWHITNRCDQRCEHCYIFQTGKPVTFRDFDAFQAKETVDKYLVFCEKYDKKPGISLTGGDPLLHPGIWDIIQYIREKNITFCILGNPFHADEETVCRLLRLGCVSYQMSIDGLEATHDVIRKPGSFQATLKAISRLTSLGMKVNIMSTASRLNYLELPEVARLMTDMGVNVYTFARYCPTHQDIDQNLTPDEYKEFLGRMWQTFSELADKNTTFTLKEHLWTPFLHELGLIDIPTTDYVAGGCNCAISHITVLEDGDVLACRRFDSRVGNIHESDFDTIFFNETMCRYRDISSLSGCGNCAYLNHCRGCHAVAAGTTGNFFTRNPQCWLS